MACRDAQSLLMAKCSTNPIFEDQQQDVGVCTRRLPLLLVGKVRLGESRPSNTAVNRGDEPPR